MRRVVLALVLPCLALAGCGQKGDLQRPKTAKSHPVPYGRDTAPTTAALMKPPVQAVPGVNSELLTRSEPRPDDPFNLPPDEKARTPVTSAPAQ
jgi:predicted small lipoprotein YifL